MRRFRPPMSVVMIAFAGLLLSACNTPPNVNRFDQINFQHLPDIKLDVAEVVVEQSYDPPNLPPNVDHLFEVSPSQTAMRWAGDRLVVGGARRQARFIVREASVVEVPLETSKGLTGFLTLDQTERYQAKIEVELQIIDGDRVAGSTVVRAKRSITVPEDITLNEREGIWYQLTQKIMNDLNGELEKAIDTHYGAYLVL